MTIYNSKMLLLLALLSFVAYGHDLYIMPASFRPANQASLTAAFHVGDSFPESEVSPVLTRLREPKLIAKSGMVSFRNLRVDGKRALAEASPLTTGEMIAAVQTVPTLIELEPAKFLEYLKEEGLQSVISWRAEHGASTKPGKERYSKYAKAVVLSGASDGFAKVPVGYVIEIIPEADPYNLNSGESLPIQVLFRGKPAADLQIEASWASKDGTKTAIVGRTGSDGRIKVPLKSSGLWRIHTLKMERCAEPAIADWESFWASMTFELR